MISDNDLKEITARNERRKNPKSALGFAHPTEPETDIDALLAEVKELRADHLRIGNLESELAELQGEMEGLRTQIQVDADARAVDHERLIHANKFAKLAPPAVP